MIIFLPSAFAQVGMQREIDSLKQLLQASAQKKDTNQVRRLLALGKMYQNTLPDSSLWYSEEAHQLAASVEFPKGKADALLDMGMAFTAKAEYDSALQVTKAALAIFVEAGDHDKAWRCRNNLGDTERLIGNYARAMQYHRDNLPEARQSGNKKFLAGSLHNLGITLSSVGNYTESQKYLFESLAIKAELGDTAFMASTIQALGVNYQEMGQLAQALDYFHQALTLWTQAGNRVGEFYGYYSIATVEEVVGHYFQALENYECACITARELDNPNFLAYCLSGQGNVLIKEGKLDKAEKYIVKALEIRQRLDDLSGQANLWSSLAQLRARQGELLEAQHFTQQALQLSKDIRARQLEHDYTVQLADILQQRGHFEEAYHYLQLGLLLKDSLFDMEKAEEAATLKLKYDLDNTERLHKIELLEKEQSIKALQLKNFKMIAFGLAGFVFLLLLLLLLFVVNNRQRKKTNAELAGINTALRKAETNLRSNYQELEIAKDKLQHFVFAISHDLRESVRAVTSFAQLLHRKLAARQVDSHGDLTQYIDFIVENGRRMSNTLDQLLLITELSDPPPVSFEVLDLKQLMETIAENLLPEEGSEYCISITDLPRVKGNLYLVRKLLECLLENSVEFKKANTPLKIELGFIPGPGQNAIFYLKDNGPGVEEQYLDWIFQPFSRLNARGKGGAGLGLSICRLIVELHAGRMWAESQPGEGLTSYFTLPLA